MSTARPFTLCVYCGSRDGQDPAFAAAATTVGSCLAANGWNLVYGGGNVGLMGRLADAALAGGATVTGVIPQSLMAREVGHTGLDALEVVDSMHQRKQRMAELADAFLALPGGIGTLEELYEVWTWRQLGYHRKPIGLLRVGSYFEPLLRFMESSVSQGFLNAETHGLLHTDDNIPRLLAQLASEAASRPARDDRYDAI
jgi:uncharacterized protein (TIGR00730 family)